MSDSTATAAHGDHGGHAGVHHYNYVKIWVVLLVLLAASILGPMLGHPIVTLITAFGIAFVKAFIVIKYFMHLTVEKKYVGFLLLTMIAFMIVFVGGVAPDVMRHEGQRWVNTAAQDVVTKGLAAEKAGGHDGHHE
jgi:caa(3)-type oxidase subunit IV